MSNDILIFYFTKIGLSYNILILQEKKYHNLQQIGLQALGRLVF